MCTIQIILQSVNNEIVLPSTEWLHTLFFRISRCAKPTVIIHISSTANICFIQCVQHINLSGIFSYVEFTGHQFCCIQDTRCAISALPPLALNGECQQNLSISLSNMSYKQLTTEAQKRRNIPRILKEWGHAVQFYRRH